MSQAITDFPMPIVTPRLLLRQPVTGDVQEYVQAVAESMHELRPWLSWARYYPTIEQVEEYISQCCSNWIVKNNNNVGLVLCIIEKTTNILVGHMVMWNIVWSVPKFEIVFWVRTPHARKGYITEATNALTRYCFLQLGVLRIEICCEVENIRAQLVPQRLGFPLDGTLRNNAVSVSGGELTDTLIFSRIDLKGLPEVEVKWGDAAKVE